MMCHEVRQHLIAHVLGELDLKTDQTVEKHLSECDQCAAFAIQTRRDISMIGRAISTDLTAPPQMCERLRLSLSHECRPARQWFTWKSYALAASVGVLVLSWMLLRSGPVPINESEQLLNPQLVLATNVTHTHRPDELKDLSSLGKLAGFNVKVPGDNVAIGKLICAKEACLSGVHVVALVYEMDGQDVILYQARKGQISLEGLARMEVDGRVFHCCSKGPKHLVVWSNGERVFMLASVMAESELRKIAMRA